MASMAAAETWPWAGRARRTKEAVAMMNSEIARIMGCFQQHELLSA